MTDTVVSYVGIDDRKEFRKLLLLSSKDLITSLNTYEQIKAVRSKKLELLKQIDENVSTIRKIKDKLEKKFPRSAYDSLVENFGVNDGKKNEKFENYLKEIRSNVDDLKTKSSKKTEEKPKKEVKAKPKLKAEPKPKKMTRFDLLQKELEAIESKLSNM